MALGVSHMLTQVWEWVGGVGPQSYEAHPECHPVGGASWLPLATP